MQRKSPSLPAAPVLNPIGGDRLVEGFLAIKAALSALVLTGWAVLAGKPSLEELLAADGWMLAIDLAAQAGQLASVILLVELPVWFQTKALNMPALGRPDSVPPRAVIRSFLMPGVHLYRPYLLAQRLWRDCRLQLDRPNHVSLALLAAWISWLGVGTLWVLRLSLLWLQVDIVFAPEIGLAIFLLQQVLGLTAALGTLLVVSDIEKCQRQIWVESGRSLAEATPPSRQLGPRQGLLAVLAGVGGGYLLIFGFDRLGALSISAGYVVPQACLAAATVLILRHPEWTRFGTALRRPTAGTTPGRWAAAGVLLGVGLALTVRGLLDHPFRSYREGFETELSKVLDPTPPDLGTSLLIAFVIVVLAPVVEEILFRGLVLPTFRLRLLPAPAVLATALLFAFVHTRPLQMLAVFFVGIALGILRLACRGLWPCFALHMAYNFVILLPVSLTGDTKIVPIWTIPIGLLLVAAGLDLTLGQRGTSEKNPLLMARWWWGSESIETAREVAQKAEGAARPAAAALRREAQATVRIARQAQKQSVQAVSDVTGRISRQGVRFGHIVLAHSAIVAAFLLVASALANAYWLSHSLIDILAVPSARDPIHSQLLADLARFWVSSLAVVAFGVWVVKATERAASYHSADSKIREFLPIDEDYPNLRAAERLLKSPRLALGLLWNAADSGVSHHHSQESMKMSNGGLPVLFFFLAVTSILCLPALLAGHPAAHYLVMFRWTLGSVLALILIMRAGRFLFAVETMLRFRQEDLLLDLDRIKSELEAAEFHLDPKQRTL